MADLSFFKEVHTRAAAVKSIKQIAMKRVFPPLNYKIVLRYTISVWIHI
jgi:hypothetical protein